MSTFDTEEALRPTDTPGRATSSLRSHIFMIWNVLTEETHKYVKTHVKAKTAKQMLGFGLVMNLECDL